MTARESVVAAARTWLGTPFLHQGRVKGVGVDCVGLLLGVASELGWIYEDRAGYGRQPDPSVMRQALDTQLVAIEHSHVGPGDIYWMAFDRDPAHVALVTDVGIIHAAALLYRVVEHNLDAVWRARIRAAYRFREVA